MIVGTSDLDGLIFYIDPLPATLLALLVLLIVVDLSTDLLRITRRKR